MTQAQPFNARAFHEGGRRLLELHAEVEPCGGAAGLCANAGGRCSCSCVCVCKAALQAPLKHRPPHSRWLTPGQGAQHASTWAASPAEPQKRPWSSASLRQPRSHSSRTRRTWGHTGQSREGGGRPTSWASLLAEGQGQLPAQSMLAQHGTWPGQCSGMIEHAHWSACSRTKCNRAVALTQH